MVDEPVIELKFLQDLKLYATQFSYKNKTYLYSDVVGIEYYAVQTNHTFFGAKFAETQRAYFKVDMTGRRTVRVAEHQYNYRKQTECAAEIRKSVAALSTLTFPYRYSRYEDEFAQKNFVQFGNVQLHRNGDVRRSGKLLGSIKQPEANPRLGIFAFFIDHPSPGLFGKRTKTFQIDLLYNRDCFVRFVYDAYNFQFSNHSVPAYSSAVSGQQTRGPVALRPSPQVATASPEFFIPQASASYTSVATQSTPAREIPAPKGFWQAITAGVRNYFKFSGRSTRPEYWYFVLFLFIANVAVAKLGGGTLTSVMTVLLLVPFFSVTVRRLHDNGRSGWWLLLGIVPIVGWIALLFLLSLRSDPSENQYGPAHPS